MSFVPSPNTNLADFVRQTEKEGCIIKGLPSQVTPQNAADKLKGLEVPVYLSEWEPGDNIFIGWFPKRVQDSQGNILFIVDYENLRPHLHVQDAALRYLG